MKNLNSIQLIALALLLSPVAARSQAVPDSAVMGTGYANDVFYSFKDGEVAAVPRTNWDLGFQTMVWTATIITNGGSDVELYTYPKADTSGWGSVDTTGLSTWPVLYDSEHDWYEGAFNRNQAGHPDYGWGKYNPISHDVVGDSIYIIKTADNKWRKIWILRKNSIANTYYFRYANLDGNDDQLIEMNNNPYLSKNFVYFSFTGNTVLDREPDTASYDLLFTKYYSVQPNGTPYPVIGALNNLEVYANEFYPVGPDFIDWQNMPFDSTKSPIGSDWKSFDFTSGWMMKDSLAYFVRTRDLEIYKLVFTGFTGSLGTGAALFEKTLVSAADVSEIIPGNSSFSVSPNPIHGLVTLGFSEVNDSPAQVRLYDLSSRTVYETPGQISNGKLTLAIPKGRLNAGLHLMVISAGNQTFSAKVLAD